MVRPSAGISLLLSHHSSVRYPLADCGQPKVGENLRAAHAHMLQKCRRRLSNIRGVKEERRAVLTSVLEQTLNSELPRLASVHQGHQQARGQARQQAGGGAGRTLAHLGQGVRGTLG